MPLNTRWNVRSADHYRIRHEQFHQSDLPRRINVFFENIFGIEKVKTDPSKFHDWVLQFDESERLLACRLFDALEFYDEEKTRQVWAEVFRKLPADTKTEMAYIGLGHGAKSGRLNPYLFRQGISRLPEYNALFSGKESKIFRDISEYENSVPGLPLPRTVIFLDDFIGTGGQAKEFLEWYIKKEKFLWLTNVTIYFCALVGFKKAIDEVKESLTGKIKDVIVGKLLDERDRAFSPDNLIWKSEQECINAKQWASEIGYQLIESNPIYDSKGELKYHPERDSLGWHGCQALVAFHHNIPSDSLPIFWYAGSRNGKEWKALMERYD